MKKVMKKLFILLAILAVSCTEKIDDEIVPNGKNEYKDPERKPVSELDQPMVDGEFTGYVYKYGFCNEPGFWHQFENYQQRIDMFQVPEDAMERLTTEGLAQTCMYYPLRRDMWAFDYLHSYIPMHMEIYNGLKELGKRAYGPAALLKLYENLIPADPENKEEADGLMYDRDINLPWSFMDRNFLEALLSSEFFTPNMLVNELERLAEAVRQKVDYINERHFHSYSIGYGFPYSVLCRILITKAERGLLELTEHETELLTVYIDCQGAPHFEAQKTYEIVTETLMMISENFPEVYILPLDKIFVMA